MSLILLEGVGSVSHFGPSRRFIREYADEHRLTEREAEWFLRGIGGGAGLVDAQELVVLDHIMGNASMTPNAQNFVALSSTTPTDAGGNFTEPAGGSYARVETEGTGANGSAWNAATGTAPAYVDNAEAVTFAQASADWAAGANLTHFGIYTLLAAGSLHIWGALTTPKPVLNGDTASFAIGAIKIQLGDPGDSY